MAEDSSKKSDPEMHRVLVIDDEEIVVVALRQTLMREGYEVITALNADKAMKIIESESFSVILTDHQMPGMTGLELLSRAKEIQPDATRILITAVLSLSTVIDAINEGEIYRFIVKPWLREELLATIRNAVQRYELICRNRVLQATTLSMNEKLKGLNADLEKQIQCVEEQNKRLDELNNALTQNLEHSVALCVRMIESYYPVLGNQARRVFSMCRTMASILDLSQEDRKTLELSGWLCDIGLVGVSRNLIKQWNNQPGSLTEQERALIEQHPILGEELASFLKPFEGVGKAIRSHHERFDGRGYPDRLRGESIPWFGRLLAVAVSYAESTYPEEDAVEAIKLTSGSAFDPEAVRVFMKALPHAMLPRKEKEVLLSDLRPGMVLAKGIYTANGMLLIPEGQSLSGPSISKLRNHNKINPISQELLVYC
ncbi:MAG: response regulator [Verrucomicrobia bacterium]|nr:response regulator [Verrucomicrobiota bacterium]MCF7708838.1 response regulator [Verrucomicrobiota bacterium]